MYLILFCFIFYKGRANKETGLSAITILLLFLLKVSAGVINLYLHNNVFAASDAAFYHWQSIQELKNATENPAQFIHEWLFNWGEISGRLNFLNRENTPYWSNLGSLFHGKFMTLSNMLSLGHIYVNVIFYNVFFFLGQLMLYKSFYQLKPEKKELLVFSIFLVPSILFWCSGIHKDGWVLSAIGFLSFYTLKMLNHWQPKYLFIVLAALFFILIIRYFYFICIVPAYFLWIYTQHKPKRPMIFLGVYSFFILIFLFYGYIDPSHNPMLLIVNKQKDFLGLNGLSDFPLNELTPTISSFVRNFPHAVQHILLLPMFELSSPLRYQLAALDSLFITSLVLLSIFYIKKSNLEYSFFLFTLFFSVTVYLFIGYTIPNSGALVRYKSEFTALLLPTLLCMSEIPFLTRCIEKMRVVRI